MSDKRSWKRWGVIFLLSGSLFIGPTLISNFLLTAYEVSSVRISAAMNPMLGLLFGWPAAFGCAAANFASDLISGYGIVVACMGFPEQLIYAMFPYYIWKALYGTLGERTRLNSPMKTVLFTILMAVNAVIVGFEVAGIQYYVARSPILTTAWFVFLNDFDICMIFGLPMMVLYDHLYSRYLHEGKRKITFNELVILISSLVQLMTLLLIILIMWTRHRGESRIEVWGSILSKTGNVVNATLILSLVAMYGVAWIKRRNSRLRVFQKTGAVAFADERRKLEFLSFPGGRPEFPLRFNAEGTPEPDRSRHILHPTFGDAWNLQLSCQKGCSMHCEFCDCPSLGFSGNATRAEYEFQVRSALDKSGSSATKKLYVNFSRMGEPVFSRDLLTFLKEDLKNIVLENIEAEEIRPGISTMMPRACRNLENFLTEYCRILNDEYGGKGSLEISLQTTDEAQRRKLFRNQALSLPEIAEIAAKLPVLPGKKIELSFVITSEAVIDARVIDGLFDRSRFRILLEPVHDTFNAVDNGYKETDPSAFREKVEAIGADFLKLGWEVHELSDVEQSDEESVAAGQLLLGQIGERLGKRPLGKKRIGLLVAIEMDAIFAYYKNVKEHPAPAGYHLYTVDRRDYVIYILQTGMGEAAAASGAQFLISRCRVSMVVNYGVVGGLTESMGKQKVCIVERVVHYKYDVSEYLGLKPGQVDGHETIFLKPSENLVRSALKAVDSLIPVTCCSGDKFVGSPEEKKWLHDTFEGDICEMEAAGVVLSCELNRVPCMLLKAVSDGLADGAEGFLAELQAASRLCLEVTDKVVERVALTVE